jgi:hypothetical protein
MKIRSMVTDLFPADGHTDRQTDRTKLTVALFFYFCNFLPNRLKTKQNIFHRHLHTSYSTDYALTTACIL